MALPRGVTGGAIDAAVEMLTGGSHLAHASARKKAGPTGSERNAVTGCWAGRLFWMGRFGAGFRPSWSVTSLFFFVLFFFFYLFSVFLTLPFDFYSVLIQNFSVEIYKIFI